MSRVFQLLSCFLFYPYIYPLSARLTLKYAHRICSFKLKRHFLLLPYLLPLRTFLFEPFNQAVRQCKCSPIPNIYLYTFSLLNPKINLSISISLQYPAYMFHVHCLLYIGLFFSSPDSFP